MDLRPAFIIVGIALVLGSIWWGDLAIWLGAPLLFLGIVLKFADAE
jgi:hypothetical protein